MAERSGIDISPTARRYEADKRDIAAHRDAEDKRQRELDALIAAQAEEMAEDADRVVHWTEARNVVAPSPEMY
jgi:hypothetical protein